MRKVCACVLMLLTMLLLTGCKIELVYYNTTAPAETAAPAATEAPKSTEAPAEPTQPAETAAPTEKPTEKPTEPPVQEPEEILGMSSALPYLLEIDRADQSIYDGPGYDYAFVDTVREMGAYTIVEEAWDLEGNLWGKLKSGMGWVDLTQIHSGEYAKALIGANFADENLLFHGDYYHCSTGSQEYCTPVVFRAYGKLRDVALFAYEFSGEDYVAGADFFSLPELTKEMPLVAELAFPGDMSMYGIRFTDESGKTYIYSIYISGRNGALVLEKR